MDERATLRKPTAILEPTNKPALIQKVRTPDDKQMPLRDPVYGGKEQPGMIPVRINAECFAKGMHPYQKAIIVDKIRA